MSKPENPSAFPNHPGVVLSGPHAEEYVGMTLRDWFAGQAMSAVVILLGRDVGTADSLAKDAYTIADAMLLARQEAR